jgi:hypothetical protein
MNVISICDAGANPGITNWTKPSLATKPNGIETLNLYHNLTKENL